MGIIGTLGAAASVAAAAGKAIRAIDNVARTANGNYGAALPSPVDIRLTLGDFEFFDMEIPEVIPFHAQQRLAVKKMIGGVRVIDAMGVDYAPIQFSGTIWNTNGMTALERAKQLSMLRDKALPLVLAWDELRFNVMISEFSPDYRFARIPFSITLEVLEDLSAPATEVVHPTIDDVATQSLSEIENLIDDIVGVVAQWQGISAEILDAANQVAALCGAVKTALFSASSLVSNTSSATPLWSPSAESNKSLIGKSTAPIGYLVVAKPPKSLAVAPLGLIVVAMQAVIAAQNKTLALIERLDAIIDVAGGVGVVAAGKGAAANSSALFEAILAHKVITGSLNIAASLQVMLLSLQSINQGVKIIRVAGANLYQIAAVEYGNAAAFVLLMKANGLSDPIVRETVTLIIPPYSEASVNDGILTA